MSYTGSFSYANISAMADGSISSALAVINAAAIATTIKAAACG